MNSNVNFGRVIINRNICDNAPECSGIAACPTGALYWDEENERIEYDAEKCSNCGSCANECPVEAILFGEDEEDYWKKKKQVDDDTRRLEELVVERFGATPIDSVILISDIEEYIDNNMSDIILLELFSQDSIDCLLHSIRVQEIQSWFPDKPAYQKVEVLESDDVSRFGVEELPAILVFKNKFFVGSISGHYSDNEDSKLQLRDELFQILN